MKRPKTLFHSELTRKPGYNSHHLLWTRRSYDSGYARALRAHPYCQVLIPAETLHKQIHHEIQTIPVPEGSDAKNTFELLVWLERLGLLDFCDPMEKKLTFLIENLKTKETVQALEAQRLIVERFLGGD